MGIFTCKGCGAAMVPSAMGERLLLAADMGVAAAAAAVDLLGQPLMSATEFAQEDWYPAV
jgi:hypothetical protein